MPVKPTLLFNLEEEAFRISKIKFPAPVPRHNHSCYELVFIIGGEGTFFMDCQNYHVENKTLFLIAPGQVHGWKSINNLEAYLLKFDLSIFVDKSSLEYLSVFHFDTLKTEGHEYEIIANTFVTLEEEYTSTKSLKESTINSLLNILLIYIQRTLPTVINHASGNALFSELNTLMHKNNYQIGNPSCYAKKLKINIKLLNQTVKEISGLTCGEYIRSKTISEAKRLLKFDTMTCNEISNHLGFVDSAYFSRFFKREVGIAPTLFRESSL